MAHHDLNNKRLVSASVSEHLHVQAALADPSVDMKRKMQQPHGGGGGGGGHGVEASDVFAPRRLAS